MSRHSPDDGSFAASCRCPSRPTIPSSRSRSRVSTCSLCPCRSTIVTSWSPLCRMASIGGSGTPARWSPRRMGAEIERRLALQAVGSMVSFTVLDGPAGRVVGMTTYMHMDQVNRRVEIGSTWYARRVQRTGLNTEAELLLLAHAFHTACAWTLCPLGLCPG